MQIEEKKVPLEKYEDYMLEINALSFLESKDILLRKDTGYLYIYDREFQEYFDNYINSSLVCYKLHNRLAAIALKKKDRLKR